MDNLIDNSFFEEVMFNVFPYSRPAFPIVTLTNAPIRQLHYHNIFEIGYCYKGSGECASTKGITSFKEGDAEFFFPFQPHISKSHSNNSSYWHFSYFDISEVFSDEGFEKSAWENFTTLENGLFGIIERERYPEICDCIKRIIETSRGTDSNKLIKCRLFIGELLIYISENSNKDPEAFKVKRNKRIAKLMPALVYIKKHYNEQIPIARLANECFMSVSSFRENFSREIGMSPKEYLMLSKMQFAKHYLENTNKSIHEICQICGFSDTSNFHKQFLKRYGTSPTAYRNKQDYKI